MKLTLLSPHIWWSPDLVMMEDPWYQYMIGFQIMLLFQMRK